MAVTIKVLTELMGHLRPIPGLVTLGENAGDQEITPKRKTAEFEIRKIARQALHRSCFTGEKVAGHPQSELPSTAIVFHCLTLQRMPYLVLTFPI